MNKKILLIGPYPPRRCGIGTHLVQFKESLQNKNNIVNVLSYSDCDGDIEENLLGTLNLLKLIKYRKKYDKIFIHFTPEQFFYVGKNLKRILNIFPLVNFYILFKLIKNLNVIFHEPPLSRFFFQRVSSFFVWSKISHAIFFTKTEKELFERKFFFKFSSCQFSIEEVNRHFIKYDFPDKSILKRSRNIHQKKKVFLMTGFLHPNKGYDIPIDIFKESTFNNSILLCLTSIRDKNDLVVRKYHNSIKEKARFTENIIYTNHFMEEKEQDSWIYLSDFVIFPYRKISNSGILGRTKLYKKKSLISKAGGLKDQIGTYDVLFNSKEELKDIMLDIDGDV
tara:strand:- start:2139 stop:3149 length:1011 start_codon:yes stop_codon:yes gene_type:complete